MTTAPIMSITDDLLAELEEAAKAATPGPWFPVSNNAFLEINTDDDKAAPSVANVCASQFLEGGNKEAQNGIHIARANPATVLALVEEVRRLRRWKSSSMKVMGPVLDYAQGLQIAPLGTSCTKALIADHARLAQKTERLTGQVMGAKEQEMKTVIRLLLAGLDSGHLDAAVLRKAREMGR